MARIQQRDPHEAPLDAQQQTKHLGRIEASEHIEEQHESAAQQPHAVLQPRFSCGHAAISKRARAFRVPFRAVPRPIRGD